MLLTMQTTLMQDIMEMQDSKLLKKVKEIVYNYQWTNLSTEEDINFEQKILSKQERQIVKDRNSLSKTKRNQNQTWQKKIKTIFFEIFLF